MAQCGKRILFLGMMIWTSKCWRRIIRLSKRRWRKICRDTTTWSNQRFLHRDSTILLYVSMMIAFFCARKRKRDRYYRNFQNHFGTDVFIYFNAPAQPWRQKLLRLETKVLYGLGMAHRYRVKDQKYTTLQKLQVAVLCLLGKPFPAAWICRRWKKAMLRWQGKNTGRVYTGNYPVNQLFFFPAENYMGTCEGEIRGRKFSAGKRCRRRAKGNLW